MSLVVVTSPRFIDLRVVTSLLAEWTEIRILVSCRRVSSFELPRIICNSFAMWMARSAIDFCIF